MHGKDQRSPDAARERELKAQIEAAERPIAGGDAWIVSYEPGALVWSGTGEPQISITDQRRKPAAVGLPTP